MKTFSGQTLKKPKNSVNISKKQSYKLHSSIKNYQKTVSVLKN